MIKSLAFNPRAVLVPPYDLQKLKSADHSHGAPARGRAAVVAAAGVIGYLLLGLVSALVWGLGHALAQFLWQRFVRKLPDQGGRKVIACVLFGALLYGVSYHWLIWYLWMLGDPTLQIATTLALAGAMLNAVSVRADDLLVGAVDVAMVVFSALWMVVGMFALGTDLPQSIFFAVCILGLIGYWFYTIFDVIAVRTALTRNQKSAADRAKLHALGQLTGGVAHDFNNLLTVIIGNLELRRSGGISPEDEEALLSEVDAAAHKASVMTAQLLAFSRRSPLEVQRVDVVTVVQNARMLLTRLLPATYTLQVSVPGSLPQIEVDAGKLETVIVNLVMNARDAMPMGGAIQLVAAARHLPAGLAVDGQPNVVAGRTLAPGHYLELTISDFGSGIPAGQLSMVLEPYFTTKPVGKGSGLGLSMAFGFAEQSGGTLSIESQEGYGTSVSLWFPLASAAAKAADAP